MAYPRILWAIPTLVSRYATGRGPGVNGQGRSGFRQTTRYIAAVRLVMVVIALAAGGPKATDVKSGGKPTDAKVGAGSGSAQGSGAGPVGTVRDVGCLTPSCAYHAGANGYFTC